MNRLVLIGRVPALLLLGGGLWLHAQRVMPPTGKHTVYIHHGAAVQTPPASLADGFRVASESIFRNAPSALLQGMTTDLESRIRQSGLVVEIIYKKPPAVENTQTARSTPLIDRLMIPLDGQYVGWVLYGIGHYSSGPLLVPDKRALNPLRDLILPPANLPRS